MKTTVKLFVGSGHSAVVLRTPSEEAPWIDGAARAVDRAATLAAAAKP